MVLDSLVQSCAVLGKTVYMIYIMFHFTVMRVLYCTDTLYVLGIGLVYQGTAHRLMTEMLLAEIGLYHFKKLICAQKKTDRKKQEKRNHLTLKQDHKSHQKTDHKSNEKKS